MLVATAAEDRLSYRHKRQPAIAEQISDFFQN
jgi:hypothetical protein